MIDIFENKTRILPTGSLLVGFDLTAEDGHEILIVGRKREGEALEVLNAFEGAEAIDIFNRLTGSGGYSRTAAAGKTDTDVSESTEKTPDSEGRAQ